MESANRMQGQVANWQELPADALPMGVQRSMIWGRQLMACRVVCPARTTLAIHTHRHEQVTLVERGRLRFHVAGQEHEVGPGAVLHFPSDVPHGAVTLEEEVVLYDIFTPIREDFLAP